jgi:RHS repeat-associated protein
LLASVTRPNGVSTAYTYDTASRLTGVNGIGYILDANGNRIQMTDGEGVTGYTYDALDRLVQATYPTSAVTYTLDSVGNRLGDGMNSFAYDPSDRITNPGYTYGTNGNLLADGAATYEYDAANRLIQMTKDGVVTTYGYDGWGNLIQETTNGVTTEFVLDENTAYVHILGEVRSDGDERLYAYGPEGFTAQQAVGGGVEYPLVDGLGSVRHLTDAGGTVILTRSYDAYGNVRFMTGAGNSRLGYTGELQDPVSGLVYLRARHYYPVLGRFLQRDTFVGTGQRPQSLNRYAYTENRPLKYTDPSGHDPCPGCVILFPLQPLLEDWGLLNPMALAYLAPTAAGTYDKWRGQPGEPAFELTADWYWEMGEQSRTYRADSKITQALMHDEGVERARQQFTANGRQDMLEFDRTWYDYKFGLLDAARELFGDVVLGGGDWSTSFAGGYQVEVINLCDTDSLVEFRVHNTTGWGSATRVWDHSLKQDEERPDVGPGGNFDQIYLWRERIAK